jgi:hypothetical protein
VAVKDTGYLFAFRHLLALRLFCWLALIGIIGLVVVTGCTAASTTEAPVSPTSVATTAISPTLTPTTAEQKVALTPTSQTISTPAVRPTLEGDRAFTIQLQSRQFAPEVGVESGLDLLRSASSERAHVLIQLFEAPDAVAKTRLESSGIKLLNHIPHNAWFASVPRTLQADDPAMSLIRWMGPILPEDKIHPDFLSSNFSPKTGDASDAVELQIVFFSDVTEGEMLYVLGLYNVETQSGPDMLNDWRVSLKSDTIFPLASEDEVQWIGPVPLPDVSY